MNRANLYMKISFFLNNLYKGSLLPIKIKIIHMDFKYKFILLLVLLAYQLHTYGQTTEGIVIKGTVTSKTNNETLVGVTVTEVNAENRIINGVITDINGQYILRAKSKSNKIVFSYIGFKKGDQGNSQ